MVSSRRDARQVVLGPRGRYELLWQATPRLSSSGDTRYCKLEVVEGTIAVPGMFFQRASGYADLCRCPDRLGGAVRTVAEAFL
jgi:hypothetical protein